MEKMKLVIAGERVHGIGYRYFLMEAALNSGIEHFRAVNVLNHLQEVHVFVAGEREQLQEFYEFVSTNFPVDASVKGVTRQDYRGYIPKIESFALVFNVGQMRTFIEVGRSLERKIDKSLEKQDAMLEKQDLMLNKMDDMLSKQDLMLEKQDTMLNKMDEMLKKQDLMLEKQDAMLSKQDEMLNKMDVMIEKQDLMLSKMDAMLSKQDETISELKNVRSEVAGVSSRIDKTNNLLEERFSKMEKEIERIKKALIRAGIDV